MDNVILTGSGGCVALGGLGPLRAAGYRVIGTDGDATMSAGAHLCDEFRAVPRALVAQRVTGSGVEVEPSTDYLAALDRLIDELQPAALLVNPDPEVLAIACSPRAAALPLLFPTAAQVLAAHDKRKTTELLAAAGVALPAAVPTGDDDAFAAGCQLLFDSERLVLAKEAASAGGENLRVLSDLDTARRVRAANPGMLFYEFLPGAEHAVFLIYREGELFLEGSFRKHHYKWGQGLRNESVDDDELFALADSAVTALANGTADRAHGTYHVNIRADVNGAHKVLEINAARAFGGTPDAYIAFAGGVNLPATYVDLVRGGTPARQRVRGGILQLQYHDYVFVEGGAARTWDAMFESR